MGANIFHDGMCRHLVISFTGERMFLKNLEGDGGPRKMYHF